MGVVERKLRVLLVEDNPGDVDLVREYIGTDPRRTIDLVCVPSLGAAREAMAPDGMDLVLLDLGLPDGTGVEVVGAMRAIASHVPIVVLTARADSTWAAEALRRDAQDYLVKDQLDGPSLHRSIRYAIERHRSQQQYRHQLSVSPEGVIVVDRDGVVRFTNEAAERLLGMAPKRVEDLPEEIRLAQEGARDVSLSTGHVVETRNVETVWQHRPSCLITLHDCTDRYRAERAMTRLAAELTRANERLERLVGTDPLTEALNRRGIDAALETELARLRRTGDELAAILIDYDNFKAINESYGHAVGDATLRALTQSVRGALRTGDYLGRVGGDEFLVLLPDTGIHVGMAVADKLRRAIKSTTLPLDDRKLSLSASLAVAGVGAQVVSLEQVLAAANLALRQSKRSGKDRVSTSDPWVEAKGPGGPTPEIDLTSIELDTYLQGIHCLDSGAVVGYEALTRGPVGGLATPDDLFRAAFEYNALTALDLRALSASIRVRSLAHLRDGWFHVNLFPSTILNTPAGRILRLLDESGETNQLCLEISEQQFLGDPAYLAGPLAVLREEGVRIALDDVGYGRSSIEALLVLEPDVVKVDRSCVRGIDARPRERRRLERLLSIIRIGGALAIVEGVETEEELRVLRDIGVSHCQGYLWGEPRPAAAG